VFDKCPRCDYPLTGLPEEHACPECGLRYDKNSRIYRLRRRSVYLDMAILGFGIYALLTLFRLQNVAGIWRGLSILLLSAYCVGMAWVAYILYRAQRLGHHVATTCDGLLLHLPGAKLRIFEWSNISRVEPTRAALGAILFIRDQRVVMNLTGMFRSPTEAAEFIRIVTDYLGPQHALDRDKGAGQRLPEPPNAADQKSAESEEIIERLTLRPFREQRALPFPVLVFALFLTGVLCLQFGLREMAIALIGVSLLVAVVGAIWSLTGKKVVQEIRLTNLGVRVFRGLDLLFECRWDEFERAVWSRWTQKFSLETASRTAVFELLAIEAGSHARLREYVDTINRMKAQRAPPAATCIRH
jgi:hypothetical protein